VGGGERVFLGGGGLPPANGGARTLFEGCSPGSGRGFLGAMAGGDGRPGDLGRFDLMVEGVAGNASAVAQNTAAAKKSASDASTSARQAETHAAEAADSAPPPSTSPGQPVSRVDTPLPPGGGQKKRPIKPKKGPP
ncbi:prophage tail fiber N-terminal domain-containing protein, partial [Escherichia coli]|nr:prophage tail fiber N-terminal domain-containing protein [Escherichia coli]